MNFRKTENKNQYKTCFKPSCCYFAEKYLENSKYENTLFF